MNVLQISTLIVVGLSGTAIAVTPSPLRQTLLMAIFGFALTALFFAFEAPDAALSELVVSSIAMPMIILAALRRLADQRHDQGKPEPEGESSEEADR